MTKTDRTPDRRENGKAEGCLAVFIQPLLLGFMDLDLDLNASPTLTGFPADPLSIEKESSVKPMEEKTPAGQPIVDREKVRQTVHVTTDPPLNHIFPRRHPFSYAPLSKLADSIVWPNSKMVLFPP